MTDESQNWMEQARDYLEYQVNLGFREVLLPRVQEKRIGIFPLEAVREELGECPDARFTDKTQYRVREGNSRARLMFIGEGPGG
jgi:hypothetical protein